MATDDVATSLSLEDVLRTLGLDHAAGELAAASQKAITRNESPTALLDHLMREQLRVQLEGRARAALKRSAIFPLTTVDTYDRLFCCERFVGAFEILVLHADGLGLSFRLDALVETLAPFFASFLRLRTRREWGVFRPPKSLSAVEQIPE